MIDYFAHVAVFERVRAALADVTDSALVTRRDELLSDAANYPEAALLGTFVDHLLMHTGSTTSEIELLERAAGLWKSGRAIFDGVGAIRATVESAFGDPTSPGAAASFNAAMGSLIGLRTQLATVQAGMDAVGRDATVWRHLPDPHPRQLDLPISRWNLGDRFLARRTEAFVRATFNNASTPRARAFALGTLASYGGNVAGSAYLGHTVGGPRRLHPRRDRIARNAVGAWIRANRTLPGLEELRAVIQRNRDAGLSNNLGADLEKVIQQSLKEAFPGLPRADLSVACIRLEEHLELLALFVRPPLPAPPSSTLMANMAPLGADAIADFVGEPPEGDDPPAPMGPGPTGPGAPRGRDDDTGSSCLIGLAIVTVLFFLIDGIVALAQGKKYDPFGDLANANTGDEGDDEDVTASSQQLVELSGSSAGTMIVNELYSFQLKVWQGMAEALAFLIKKGLVYPDDLSLANETFTQFTALGAALPWPLRTEVGKDEGYLAFPSGALEHPVSTASQFPANSSPFTFVDVPSVPVQFQSAPTEALRVWRQIAREQQDSVNFDLDADRGLHSPCWQVAEKTSIGDDPLSVEVLAYTEL